MINVIIHLTTRDKHIWYLCLYCKMAETEPKRFFALSKLVSQNVKNCLCANEKIAVGRLKGLPRSRLQIGICHHQSRQVWRPMSSCRLKTLFSLKKRDQQFSSLCLSPSSFIKNRDNIRDRCSFTVGVTAWALKNGRGI